MSRLEGPPARHLAAVLERSEFRVDLGVVVGICRAMSADTLVAEHLIELLAGVVVIQIDTIVAAAVTNAAKVTR